ncbi:hypothetical protein, partial [Rhodovulum sulfidophilum]|uniref:hypothetical protein n=1 Tax=Rhodovulum sulfidophilum TaxID=35806 RepID=UPI001F234614
DLCQPRTRHRCNDPRHQLSADTRLHPGDDHEGPRTIARDAQRVLASVDKRPDPPRTQRDALPSTGIEAEPSSR